MKETKPAIPENLLTLEQISPVRHTVLFGYSINDVNYKVAVEMEYRHDLKQIDFTVWLCEGEDENTAVGERYKICFGSLPCESTDLKEHIREVTKFMQLEETRSALLHIFTCDGNCEECEECAGENFTLPQ